MKILRVGDVQEAACHYCKSFEAITFKLRNVPFSDGTGLVKNILAGVCDKCEEVVVIPHQSTPSIIKQRESLRKPIESRVPVHMIDILNLASYELSGGTDFVGGIVKYYIHALVTNKIPKENLVALSKSDLFKGKAQRRLSLKGRNVEGDLTKLKQTTKINKTSDLLRRVILTINDDILVNKNPKRIESLKGIIAAIS